MAFFLPRTVYHSQASLTPVFRLASGSDRHPRCSGIYRFTATGDHPWNPRFHVRETEDAYLLHGELPGLNKDHVTVEFPEPQKLVIRSRVERQQDPDNYSTTEENEDRFAAPEESADDVKGAPSEASSSSTRSFQATVEDDDQDDFQVIGQPSEEKIQKQAQKQLETEAQTEQQQQPAADFCRRQGPREFIRTFTFPGHVDPGFVTADMKDGLLSIVVPKAKPQIHHVIIN